MPHNNGIIHLMRGDTYIEPIKLNMGDRFNPVYYKLKPFDTIYFGLMQPNQAFEDAVLKKKFTYNSDMDVNGDVILKINPEDTLNLPVGKYYYMIKLKIHNDFGDIVKTIVKPTQFYLDGNNVQKVCDNIDDVETYDIQHIILDGTEITLDSDEF